MSEITSVFQLKLKLLNETDKKKRSELLKLINDEAFIKKLLNSYNEDDIRWALTHTESQDILKDYATSSKFYRVRMQAILKIEDQQFLKRRAIEEDAPLVRTVIMSKIKDQEYLYNIAISDEYDILLRDCAVSCIKDEHLIAKGIISWNSEWGDLFINRSKFLKSQYLWEKIYSESTKETPKYLAARRIENVDVLINIATNSEFSTVRAAAIERLTSIIE